MIDEILPDKVRSSEAFHDPAGVMLFPEEAALISKAVAKRRHEFTTVRHCAREALAALGLPPSPILPGERGAPGWPDGIVGSMTHCAGYRAAVVAHHTDLASIGIDAEPNAPLPEGVLDAIARPEEKDRLRRLPGSPHPANWDRLLFSAKESVYKTWFPLTRAWLDFEDASIELHPATATFHARLLVDTPATADRPLREFHGRWLANRDLVITAIAYPG
ncbi:4'-phosphopantetheinyl transferase family protein [Saccharopolyspora phatthalungensis]|uniref:4'-phosphopantetheinyl transferase EntD n=1 Tax=Saccharopolyspora phatthalungensis TaxID=664693 RepID=A0A840QDS6_9PSEU|nr:4'-phosphopantetheinyl transferase superfamily protein [Saccharopolyspora phatthalungensis]MBB5157970.1 4'-phosphopantetheinyl transferase EntD [Saccharopolyspora phatthalungensis]